MDSLKMVLRPADSERMARLLVRTYFKNLKPIIHYFWLHFLRISYQEKPSSARALFEWLSVPKVSFWTKESSSTGGLAWAVVAKTSLGAATRA